MVNMRKEKVADQESTRNCTIPTGGPEINPELYNS